MKCKQEMKEDATIWNHGREKGRLTNAIKALQMTRFKEHLDVIKVINLLKVEHERLSSINPIEK